MENKHLKQKMLNLVTFNSKDRAIVTKLNSNEVINPLSYFQELDLKNLFEKQKAVPISENNWLNTQKELEKCSSYRSFQNKLDERNLFLPKIKINSLIRNFAANQKNAITYLNEKYSKIDIRMEKINNLAKAKEFDSGEWFFYLCRYFLVGSLPNSKEIIKAPLFFQPVFYNNKKKELEIKENEEWKINEKLIVHLIKSENKKTKLLAKWNEIENINEALIFLNKEFDLKLNIENKIIDFINEDVIEIKNRLKNNLIIEDSFILGLIIPSGGKLKQDLSNIIELDVDIFDDFAKKEDILVEELLLDENKEIIQISPLNFSQLLALYGSLETNTIIHGPPGTGKSETIANILANILTQNKTALMVSEKKAALDVLIDRLGPLRDFGIFFQDSTHSQDKKIFFGTIQKLEKIYKENKNNYDIDYQYHSNIFKEINVKHQKIMDAWKILNQMKDWRIENFDYNDYLYWKNKNLNLDVYHEIINNEIYKLTKKDFFSIKSLINFLQNNNLLNKNEYTNFHTQMEEKYKKFYKNLEYINKYWTKFDIKWLSILEIKEIENAQPDIDFLFKKHHGFNEIFQEDLFYFENNLEKYNELKTFARNINIDEKYINQLFSNNSFIKLDNELKQHSFISRNKIISRWLLNNEIGAPKAFQKTVDDWKKIDSIFQKSQELHFIYNEIFEIYLQNINVLKPINVLFYLNNFLFEKYVTTFIENDWIKFGINLPIIISKYKIEFDQIEISNKIHLFETKILSPENQNLLQKYLDLKNEIDQHKKIDWKLINENIYQLQLNKWTKKIDESILKEDIMEIFRISNLKRYPKIKPFIRKHFKSLMELFPIWISKPEDVADVLECEEGIFDYGIFDEASQMFLERAFPILYRTKIKIVAGDEKQLKPSSFFVSRVDEEENEDEDDIFEIDFNNANSLLTRAVMSGWNEILLNNHYRSVSQDLIEFSNLFIYDGKLNIASINKDLDAIPLEVINVEGFFENGINKVEAEKVINVLEENIDKYHKILVITFNIPQSLYIKSQLDKNKNANIRKKLSDNLLVVTNLENVQGNEGDLVIISISYAKNPETYKLRNSFGPLNMEGGKNRLNVALTRAKTKMVVIKSFMAIEMAPSMSNENAQCFKEFINYCDLAMTKNKEIDETMNFEKNFEKEIYSEIDKLIQKNNNYKIITNFKIGSKILDIAIFDLKKKNIKIGICFENWNNNNVNPLATFDNKEFIESRGYIIYEISEIKWWLEKAKIIQEIAKKI
ncbi:MAG: AAA domain-containing protein [Metamycoplasmataceae bacterium]